MNTEKNIQNYSTQMVHSNTVSKVRNISDTNILKNTLKSISLLLGIKEIPDENILQQMVNIIKDEFGYLTIPQITDAVKKALSGKLNVDFEPYNNFSIPYICKILVAYGEYEKINNDQPLFPEEKTTVTEDEKKRRHKVWLNDLVIPAIENFYKEGEPVADMANTIYNYLRKIKIINFTDERKAEIWAKAKEAVIERYEVLKSRERGEARRFSEIIKDLQIDGADTKMQVQDKAKSMALQGFMNDCKEIDRDLINEIRTYEKM